MGALWKDMASGAEFSAAIREKVLHFNGQPVGQLESPSPATAPSPSRVRRSTGRAARRRTPQKQSSSVSNAANLTNVAMSTSDAAWGPQFSVRVVLTFFQELPPKSL